MPRPLAPTFRAFAIAVLAALPFAFLGACATETGVTPDCTPNDYLNGTTPAGDKDCTGYAVCAESPENPSACCKSADGKAYVGDQLAFCLLSYGVGAPTGAASSSSTSSTGTGSGGAGGGN
jgi:hypothetical protein